MTETILYITNFPFLSSNIPSSPAYGVFISQLIRYARACSSYEGFMLRTGRPVSYSNRDTSWNTWNRHSGSLTVDTGILFSNIKSPSHECLMTFWPLTNSDFPTNQTSHQFYYLDTELGLHRIMSGFHGAFATGVTCQQGTLTLLDTWCRRLILGLACAPIGETFLDFAWYHLPANVEAEYASYNTMITVLTFNSILSGKFWMRTPRSCKEIKNLENDAKDGVYKIRVNTSTVKTYCDMTTDRGGWTVWFVQHQ